MTEKGASMTNSPDSPTAPVSSGGILAAWHRIPLYVRIVIAMLLGIIIGKMIGLLPQEQVREIAKYFLDFAKIILDLLKMVAVPLIFTAVIHAIMNAQIPKGTGKRIVFLLLTNTLVAIFIGLLVGNLLQPGSWVSMNLTVNSTLTGEFKPWDELKSKIPTSLVGSLADNLVIPTILIALALGIALRRVQAEQELAGKKGYASLSEMLETLYQVLLVVLHWIIDIIPFAVFAIVVKVVALEGLRPFLSLIGFVVSVLIALSLQVTYYLVRVKLQSWVGIGRFLRGGSEALLTAFCTASSTATAPLNYTCLREKIGLRESSATMGALVGSNFNNDGTALYEAMGPMYIAQALNNPIPLIKQPVVAFMSVVASVGAPGIPEAGLVTMMLVFQAVGLPTEYVALLLPVDWFLDRCRTMVNLMGDMTVACILDGKTPEWEERDSVAAAVQEPA
jgi:DAACS family dicarboxylate/amino acid:cation (Na+ or H+) symporter